MAVETSSLTLFSQGNVFSTLAGRGNQDSGLAALSRGLRAALDPLQQLGLLNQPIERPGFSADTPALFYHPTNLSLQNTLLLAELNLGREDGAFGSAAQDIANAMFRIQEFASIDRLPFLMNDADRVLRNASFGPAVVVMLTQEAEEEASAPIAVNKVSDFTKRPSEQTAFGSTYSAAAADSSLNARFESSVGIHASGNILLSSLVQRPTTGAPTHYAVSLRGETGDTPHGQLTDATDIPVGSSIVLTAAEFATYKYQASSNGGLDYLSVIELSDPGGDGTYDTRGVYQTVAIGIGEEEGRKVDRGDLLATGESYIDYTFYAEAGPAVQEVRLEFSGLSGGGITDVLDAINQGRLRLKVSEDLGEDGLNEAVADLYVSSGNTIVARFARGAAEEGFETRGIDVEVRAIDSTVDISSLEVTAKFA